MPSPFSPSAQPDRLRGLLDDTPHEDEDNTGWLVTFSDLVLQLFAFALVAAALSGLHQAHVALFGPESETRGAAALAAADPDAVPSAEPAAGPRGYTRARLEVERTTAQSPPVAEVWLPAPDERELPPSAAPAAAGDGLPEAQSAAQVATAALATEFVGPPMPRVAAAAEPTPSAPDPRERRVAAIGEYLRAWLGASALGDAAQVEVHGRELVVALSDAIGFAPGRAELQPTARRIVSELRGVAAGMPGFDIDVSGHTDDRPIRTARFPSNLELSLARAAAVAQEMAAGAPELRARTVARGFAEQRPIASNGEPAGRARNRRVEIRLVPSV